ncbi:hypothetical protein L6452_10289 [Arctium lappa]|uniref:Uncharacterized protein n=1 Tax=Arctium lappa TaxID=4217 RepID=A0ACB9DLZ8_ARCLA|nr:hypothetical protein L6452_10289 [Arctium lappa]
MMYRYIHSHMNSSFTILRKEMTLECNCAYEIIGASEVFNLHYLYRGTSIPSTSIMCPFSDDPVVPNPGTLFLLNLDDPSFLVKFCLEFDVYY